MLGFKVSTMPVMGVDVRYKYELGQHKINKEEQSSDEETTSSLSTVLGNNEANRGLSEEEEHQKGLLRPTNGSMPALVRKKSGQLVKSSLKLSNLTKSISTSSLSPGKSVRFASRLANVKMFDGMESPRTVSTAENSPICSPHILEDPIRLDYFDFDWDREDISDITSDSSDEAPVEYGYSSEIEVLKSDVDKTKYEIERTDVVEPRSIYDRLDKVCYLQSLQLSPDKQDLFGYVMVRNITYEKSLSIKLTIDNWKSSIIINNAAYINSFPSINYDRFRFTVSLNNFPKWASVQFVIKYCVNGETYWDNNNSQNYHVTLRPYISHSSSRNPRTVDSAAIFDHWLKALTEKDTNGDSELDVGFLAPSKQKSEFHHRYNINNNWDVERLSDYELKPPKIKLSLDSSTPLSNSSQPTQAATHQKTSTEPALGEHGITRPAFKSSFSQSDILAAKPRYSRSYRSKYNSGTEKESERVLDVESAQFNSQSYTKLIESYCFSNGRKPSKTKEADSILSSPHSLSVLSYNDCVYI